MAYMAAVIRDPRDVAAFTGRASTTILQSGLGHFGKLDDINLVPLNSDMWLLIGIIYSPCDNHTQNMVQENECTQRSDKVVSGTDCPMSEDGMSEVDMRGEDEDENIGGRAQNKNFKKCGD
jgi:hypothetical protein